MDTLLVGPEGHGGEGVYLDTLRRNPPAGVVYTSAGGFHTGAPGVTCRRGIEVALNRLVHPLAIPDMGFRALRLDRSFDLVHVHAHPVSLSRLGATPLVMSEGSSSAVYIGEYLGWDDLRLARGYRRARRIYRALGIADRLLALERVTKTYVFSDWAREVNVRWGADPDKLEVVHPGFPEQPARHRDRPVDEFTFLFVGGDFERKGGFELLEAFAQLAKELRHVRLLLAGTDPHARNPDRLVHSWVGEARREHALATLAELERHGRVWRTNWIDRHRLLDEIYPRADAFVMTSHAEGFGFTNVEAMSFGIPVITSTAGPGPEIVQHGETGLVVPPGDAAVLHDAMAMLAQDPSMTTRLGDGARRCFLERFTLRHLQARLGELYESALETS
jgi:glycosyltransferase involved in cell wall biosynthesis